VASKRFSFVGRLTGDAPPGSSQVQQTTIFGLDFQHDYPREDSDTVTINSSDVAPYTLLTAAVPAIRLFALRVLTPGQTVKVKITTAVGTDQTLNVSNLLLLDAPLLGDEIVAVKLVSNSISVDVEYFAAGDATFGTPPPPTSATPGISYNDNDQVETTDTSEGVALEFSAPFGMIPASFVNVEYRVGVIASVTGGTGTLRLRRGGTIGAADGTTELTGTVTETSPTLKEFTATVAHPSGTQLVKATLEHPTGGQTLTVRSLAVVINGV
jgi:hypothetical protein